MKKSLIFFPAFMLLLSACSGANNENSSQVTPPTDTSSVAPAPGTSGQSPTSTPTSAPTSSSTPGSSEVDPSSAAPSGTSSTPAPTMYTITWNLDNGSEPDVTQVEEGEVPSHAVPSKASTAAESYEFAGWNPVPVAATGNATYTATYTPTPRSYTIRFLDGDGNEVQSSSWEYGETPVYSGATPTKADGAHVTYTWDGGWNPAIAQVTGDQTYTATFTENPEQFTVRFFNGSDLYSSVAVNYGETVNAPAVDPTKEPDADVARYVFNGWDADLTQPITENKDIQAKWIEYAVEEVVDNFSAYDDDHPLDDNGWQAVKLESSWVASTAPIDISQNSIEGNQALRLLGYRNGVDFGVRKTFNNDQPARYANAVKIKMMTPSDLKASAPKFIMNFTIDMMGTPLGITLKHAIPATTAEWFEVVIPFAHDQWQIWNNEFGSIQSIAEGRGLTGLDPAVIPTMLDDFIVYLAYPTGTPQRFASYIDSVSFVTTDSTEVSVTDTMSSYTRYTGTTATGNVARVDIESQTEARFRIIDLAEPVAVQGAYEINGNSLVFNSYTNGFLHYEGRITDDGQKIVFVSASSSIQPELAAALQNMDLNAVQVLENAESYSADGVGYSRDHAEDTRSGARGAYFMEIYNGSSGVVSPFAGGDWKLMGNGEQVKLKNDGTAHSGSKHLAFQSFANNARYLQWNLFKGNGDLNRYRGSKLSFWLKSATTPLVDKLYFYALSKYNPTQGDIYEPQPSSCRRYEINSTIPQTWTHYELDIDPNGVYYGFAMLQRSGKATWLHLDDVEIYTASPYACAATGVTLDETSISLAPTEEKQLTATVSPADASNKNVSWTSSDNNVATVDDNGVVTAVNPGNAVITATTVVGGYTDTCDVEVTSNVALDKGQTYSARLGDRVNALIDIIDESHAKLRVPGLSMNVDGTYSTNLDDVTFTFGGGLLTVTASADKRSLTFKSISGDGLQLLYGANFEMIFGEDAETYASAGTMYYQNNQDENNRSGARGAYYCEYKGGGSTPVGGSGWCLMGGSGNQLDLDTSVSVDGGQSLKMRFSSAGEMRYMQWDLFKGTALPKTGYSSFGFWIKNPSSYKAEFNLSVYKVAQVTTANVLGGDDARAKTGVVAVPAGTDWTYYSLALDPTATYYGYAIWFNQASSSDFVRFDKAAFQKNSYENPFNNFFAYSGLNLNGTVKGGAASLAFGANDACTLTVGSPYNCTYKMYMSGGSQKIAITTPAGVIVGSYSVDNAGKVSIVAEVVPAALDALLQVGDTLES